MSFFGDAWSGAKKYGAGVFGATPAGGIYGAATGGNPASGTAMGQVGGAAGMDTGSLGGMAKGFWNSVTGQYDPNSVPNLQNDTRNQQVGAERVVGDWALTGKGPSAAQELVARNRAEGAATQVGMAKSLGGDPALANRNAAEGIARGNAEASFQGSLLRSQEQQQAMQNYLDSLHATRAQDLGYQNALWGIGSQNAANEQAMWMSLLSSAGKAAGGATAG